MAPGEFGRYGKVLRFNSSFQKIPSVGYHPGFSAHEDSRTLSEALKDGKDKDIDVVVDILTTRSSEQRQEIRHAFDASNEKSLEDMIAKKTSGDLETLLLALIDSQPVYDGKMLDKAMKGLGTNEQVLVDVICTKSNAQIRQLKQTYEAMFSKDLEKQVGSETSGSFKKLLLNILSANRDESSHIDTDMAARDANVLANEKKPDEHFADVFAFQNQFQLQQLFLEFKVLKGEKIQDGVSSKFGGDFQKAASAIVNCAINKEAYFAEQLYSCMKGAGTKEARLNWFIISRSEIDLINVKMEFEKIYKESVDKWIEGDTSGKYREALKILVKSRIGNNKK